ncbi:hypothetical protein IscW_ISCW003492 [Ixodes scapularis]|uniref:Uncharacterized protein n=1 Tax=Ixodes scapularis TaxID=6945 RepID=B7PEB2_IXOSC|nr:hypothetical protein IscW_ISCW003492 [Ixodes scapularis]|eukprot:XP_002400784.1 hypothetical protein IscW_ISCW003492 [Ixodes scapularis]
MICVDAKDVTARNLVSYAMKMLFSGDSFICKVARSFCIVWLLRKVFSQRKTFLMKRRHVVTASPFSIGLSSLPQNLTVKKSCGKLLTLTQAFEALTRFIFKCSLSKIDIFFNRRFLQKHTKLMLQICALRALSLAQSLPPCIVLLLGRIREAHL